MSKVIENLTPEQEAKLDEYKEKWLKIGLNTEPANRDQAEIYAKKAYESAGLKPPEKFVWFDSPKQALDEVEGMSLDDFTYGNQDAGWLSFYNYFLEVCDLDCCEPLVPLMELSKHCGWWAPYEELAVMIERPVEIHFSNELLHKDLAPAIVFKDGFGIYALNGVRMPKDMVMTPADQIDPKVALKETNVEIRKEIIKKIGLEKVYGNLNKKILDTKGDYELVDLEIFDEIYRPYLKMTNPSTGDIHLEGIEPNCKTVDAALAWRNGLQNFTQPLKLT
jgi:hypothetical protein